jgi:hypothetical protein
MAAGRAKTPGGVQGENTVLLVALGRSVPGGPPRPLAGENPGSRRKGRAAPDPGLRRRRCRVNAGLESEGGPLVLLVADAQREVVQRAAKDCVWAVVQRLERRYMSVPPHKHCQSAGEVVGQLRQRSAGGGSVVSSDSMFGSTQCLRKLLKKNSGRKFWGI